MAITMGLTGLTCKHCEAHVREELEALDGITAVRVNLVPKGLTSVELEGEASDEALREAIDEAGDYTVESIERS